MTVVTAFAPEGPAGATASAVCSLSLDPMMMLVCLDRGSRTLSAVREAGKFGINVLGLDQRNAAEVFATKA
ncbi:MAG: flavin reductase family protein, partial [Actinomycetota bacterium]|nr:flavin reductase family protein [Actinomycetota bacterium]